MNLIKIINKILNPGHFRKKRVFIRMLMIQEISLQQKDFSGF